MQAAGTYAVVWSCNRQQDNLPRLPAMYPALHFLPKHQFYLGVFTVELMGWGSRSSPFMFLKTQ